MNLVFLLLSLNYYAKDNSLYEIRLKSKIIDKVIHIHQFENHLEIETKILYKNDKQSTVIYRDSIVKTSDTVFCSYVSRKSTNSPIVNYDIEYYDLNGNLFYTECPENIKTHISKNKIVSIISDSLLNLDSLVYQDNLIIDYKTNHEGYKWISYYTSSKFKFDSLAKVNSEAYIYFILKTENNFQLIEVNESRIRETINIKFQKKKNELFLFPYIEKLQYYQISGKKSKYRNKWNLTITGDMNNIRIPKKIINRILFDKIYMFDAYYMRLGDQLKNTPHFPNQD